MQNNFSESPEIKSLPHNNTKMKKTILAVLTMAALSLGAQAVPITGDIDFAGQATFNTTSLATATQVINFKSSDVGANNTAMVTSANGSFTGLAGTIASFPNVYTFSPSSAVSPLWTVGGFTFNLTSSTIVAQTSTILAITGVGILTGPAGFDATPGTWAFTSQQAGGGMQQSFSFSANTNATGGATGVPEGGSTVALLGAVLIGVVALRRKFATA